MRRDLARPAAAGPSSLSLEVLDGLPDAYAVLDTELRFRWVNPPAAALLGATPAELVGAALPDLVGPAGPALAGLAEAGREQRTSAVEVFVEPADAWLEIRAMPLDTELLAAITDVTARRRDRLVHTGNRDVLRLIAENAPLADVLTTVVATVEAQSRHGALASILLLAEDGRHLRHGAAPSLPAEYNAAVDGIAVGPAAGSCGTAAFRRQQVVVSDIATDPLWADYRQIALPHGLRSCWSNPVFAADGELLATFAIYYRQSRTPSEEDQQLIDQVTRTVAVAVQHQRTLDRLNQALAAARAASDHSRRLHEFTADLAVAVTPEDVVGLTVEHSCAVLGIEEAHVLAGPSAAAAERGRALRFPLRTPGRELGELVLVPADGRELTDEQHEQAAAVAALCAQALARAADYAETHRMAETLQRSLLTEAPALAAFAVEVGYRPAEHAAEVGGDWYDTFPLEDDRLAVVIGDVGGHDVAAAAAMGQLRNMTRAVALDGGYGPAEVLIRLDRLVARLGVTRFATMIYAELWLDPGGPGMRVRWANAGHPPPLLVTGTGAEVLEMPVTPPLGVTAAPARREGAAPVPAGGTLLLYTDGLVETRSDPIDARIAALARHVAARGAAPVAELRDHAVAFVDRPIDDVAVLAVRRAR